MAAAGHRVIMADCQRFTVARWSNSVVKYVTLPSPALETAAFIKALEQLVHLERVDHLVPTCEEAFYISRYKDQFNCYVWTAPFELMNRLHNKASFITMAEGYFPIPKTIEVAEFNNWENAIDFVFKKKYSRFGTSVIMDADREKLQRVRSQAREWIAQEKITGREVCVYSVWHEGKMHGFACYHPLYRFGKGAGIFFEPVKNEDIFNCVKRFGESCDYTGQLSFDIIIREQVPYVIECNPRGTSGAHLLNSRLNDAFFGDQLVMANNHEEFSIRYAMLLRHPAKLLEKRVRRAKDVIFAGDDLKPYFLQVLSIFEILYLKLSRNQTLLEATTGDIEWNGTSC